MGLASPTRGLCPYRAARSRRDQRLRELGGGLAIESATVPDELLVTGRTENGIVMAVRHRSLPLHGVQFHPESVLTQGGHRMLANWLAECGLTDAVQRSVGLAPLVHGSVD